MDVATQLQAWLGGDLSPAARIWTAAGPPLALTVYMLGGTLVFALRNRIRGEYSDREMVARGSSAILGAWLRNYFAWIVRPLFSLAIWSRLPPNAITTLSLLLAGASGVALAAGRFALGGWLYIGAAICDFLDGRLARETGRSSESGALFDSVLDRYCEAFVLLGLAVYYRDSWVLYPVLAALVGSMMVSYVKARGEAMGVAFPNIGLMQRPERIALLGATVALSPIIEALVVPTDPRPIHRLAVVGLIILAATTHITAIQRLVFGRRALSEHTPASGLFSRGSMFRNLSSSGVATAADFALVAALVGSGLSAPLATLIGCVLGGVIHFTLGRTWAFHGDLKTSDQASRYLIASGSGALLNSGLVAVVLMLPDVPYQVAWLLVRATVFATWNHPLSRDYVFERSAKAPETDAAVGEAGPAEPAATATAELSDRPDAVLTSPAHAASPGASELPVNAALGETEAHAAGELARSARRSDGSGAYPNPADPILRTG